MKKFLSLAQHFNLPVFLADVASLALLSRDDLLQQEGRLREPHCTFLCTGRPLTSFGLLANLWKYDVSGTGPLFPKEKWIPYIFVSYILHVSNIDRKTFPLKLKMSRIKTQNSMV